MERIVYDCRPVFHPGSIPSLAGRTATIGSVSKEYRMIGWRVGLVVGPPALTDRISNEPVERLHGMGVNVRHALGCD